MLTLALLAAAMGATAQVEVRTSDMLRLGGLPAALQSRQGATARVASVQDNRVEFIIRYDDADVLRRAESLGAEVVSLLSDRFAILSVDASEVGAVAALSGVRGAMLGREVRRANDKASVASGVDAVRNGTGLPFPLDGSDVIVALYDIGIDPNHINFKDEEGNPRVTRIWHYETASAKPTIYETPQQISSFDSDTGSDSHGTHVAGIITGSFRDTSSPDAPDYRGMAPGAEIVIATGEGYNTQILDAIKRVGEYAREQGKPCVMNLSFGDNLGPHDGSDEFTEAINELAEEYGVALALAGGNERDEAIAIIKKLTADDPKLSTLMVKGYEEVGGYFQTYSPVEVWTEDDTPFEVTLDIVTRSNPDEPVYSYTIPTAKEGYVVQGDNIKNFLSNTNRMDLITEGTEFHNLYTNSFMGGEAGVDPYNGRYRALLNVYIEGRTASAVSRNFVRITVKGEPGKKIFLYCDGTYMNFGSRNIPGLDVPDGNGTNSNMASGQATFAVGSYVTANYSESPYPFGTIGDASYFSSYGETPDGRIMPDIMAPGQVIASSRNTYMSKSAAYLQYYPVVYTYTDTRTRKSYDWTLCAGTSQASPHVAGIMALMRGADPTLTPAQVYDVLRSTADMPESDTPGWGYGKVNARKAVAEVLRSSGADALHITSGILLAERTADGYLLLLPGNGEKRVSVWDMAGVCRFSASTSEGEFHLPTDGLDNGIYIVRAESENTSRVLKIHK